MGATARLASFLIAGLTWIEPHAAVADTGHSARAVVRVAAVLFALGSFAVFVGAGGRRHAKPPVGVPTDPSDDEPT